jgi:hypothetical protein
MAIEWINDTATFPNGERYSISAEDMHGRHGMRIWWLQKWDVSRKFWLDVEGSEGTKRQVQSFAEKLSRGEIKEKLRRGW